MLSHFPCVFFSLPLPLLECVNAPMRVGRSHLLGPILPKMPSQARLDRPNRIVKQPQHHVFDTIQSSISC